MARAAAPRANKYAKKKGKEKTTQEEIDERIEEIRDSAEATLKWIDKLRNDDISQEEAQTAAGRFEALSRVLKYKDMQTCRAKFAAWITQMLDEGLENSTDGRKATIPLGGCRCNGMKQPALS